MDSKGDSLLSRAREGIRHLFWRGSYRPNQNKHNHVKSVELELGQPEGYEQDAQKKFTLDLVENLVYSRERESQSLRERDECGRPQTVEMTEALTNGQQLYSRRSYDFTGNFGTRRRSRDYLSLY